MSYRMEKAMKEEERNKKKVENDPVLSKEAI